MNSSVPEKIIFSIKYVNNLSFWGNQTDEIGPVDRARDLQKHVLA
jgi:hypothetical protein